MGVEIDKLKEVIANPDVQQRLREIGVQELKASYEERRKADECAETSTRLPDSFFETEANHNADIRQGVATCIASLLDEHAALTEDIPHMDYFSHIAHTGRDPFSGDRFLPRW